MRACIVITAGALLALAGPARALEVSFDAYVDLRLVAPPGERGWIDGGLGKFRFGAAQPSPNFRFAEAVGQGTLAVDDDLQAVAVLRLEPEQRSGLDVLEAYGSWRPQAQGSWRWSAKAGAFFPPVSVENDDLGWTSPYTLTPSAINSWVGEELRTIGGEATLAHASDWGTLSASAALFCCNEPAGVLIAWRGWAMDDRPTGLFERVRVPDATMALFHRPFPARTGLFENIDGRLGWYARLGWDIPGWGQIAALRYDNRADPAAHNARDDAWLTRFWNVSLKSRLFGVAILGQALHGDTAITDALSGVTRVTKFESAFVLLSYDLGDWRVAGRAEAFNTRASSGTMMNEDGHAFTAAVSWYAADWLRLSAELLAIDSRRRERLLEGGPIGRSDTQFQLGARGFL
ncbi:MAG: hypothetical protein WDN08_21015 [Rhizomicrobium sp.]